MVGCVKNLRVLVSLLISSSSSRDLIFRFDAEVLGWFVLGWSLDHFAQIPQAIVRAIPTTL